MPSEPCSVCQCNPCIYPAPCAYARGLSQLIDAERKDRHALAVRLAALGANGELTTRILQAMSERFAALEARLPVVAKPSVEPIPMRLPCPGCGVLHLDEREFATKPHHTHSCQSCGLTWRPAVAPTVGVQFLPGFKNAATTSEPTPPPGNSGIPEGFKLGDGWSKARPEWECTHRTGGAFDCYGRRAVAAWENNAKGGSGACAAHAVEMGALVPVEPPAKAEAAQAAEPRRCQGNCNCAKDRPESFGFCATCSISECAHGAKCRFQAAEPSAPAGFRRRPTIAELETILGGAHQLVIEPDGTTRAEPIAEPATPPVTAKLSARVRANRDSAQGAIVSRVTPEAIDELADEVAELETALDAANKESANNAEWARIAEGDRDRMADAAEEYRKTLLESSALYDALRAQVESQIVTRDARIASLEAALSAEPPKAE